jgi:hypothetical protein
MKIEISIGEAIDRLTILKIKSNLIEDPAKRANILRELDYTQEAIKKELKLDEKSDEYKKLYEVNLALWKVEDELRVLESKKHFCNIFIQLARSVYMLNDERAKIKKDINIKHKSQFVEEKSYKDYKNS